MPSAEVGFILNGPAIEDDLVIPAGDEMAQDNDTGVYQLKKLKPKHKQVLSLVAQGLGRSEIASIIDITPEYVTMLTNMPICQAYLNEMTSAAQVQMDAAYVRSVQVVTEAMEGGTTDERLRAARLQMEATKRIGAGSGSQLAPVAGDDRLERLANRLIGLLDSNQKASGRIDNGDV